MNTRGCLLNDSHDNDDDDDDDDSVDGKKVR